MYNIQIIIDNNNHQTESNIIFVLTRLKKKNNLRILYEKIQ